MPQCRYCYIRASKVRQIVKESGKRCGADFLYALDVLVHEKILSCIQLFNGHRKTLDGTMVKMSK